MGYVQYTKCVQVGDKIWPGNPKWPAVIAALALLIGGGGLTPYTAIPLLLIVIGYCNWWLYDRLICLGGDRCAIGLLGKVEPPEAKSGFDAFDTDYSVNLVLAPHQYQELPPDYPDGASPPPGEDPKEWADKRFKEALHRQIADDGMQGVLIKETTTTGDRKDITGAKKYDFEGYFSTIGGSSVLYTYQPYLHCEFEGAGIKDLLKAAEIALALATAAAVACTIPFIGTVVCLLLSAAALIVSLVGVLAALADKAKPNVVDPTTGKPVGALHQGQDILFVSGTWVYDSAHEGWNEIHPIKNCQLVGTAKYERSDVIDWEQAIAPYLVGLGRWSWDATNPQDLKPIKTDGPPKPEDWTGWVESWCSAVGRSTQAETIEAQGRDEHQWQVHPLVDGCRPRPAQPPIH